MTTGGQSCHKDKVKSQDFPRPQSSLPLQSFRQATNKREEVITVISARKGGRSSRVH